MAENTQYENRVVFFFDILGFRELIDTTLKEKNDDCSNIYDVFESISLYYQDEIDEKYSASKQITFFSDSVIISFIENEPDQIFQTISDIQILLLNLVQRNVVMRGAISYGKLFHSDKYIFGPAFVEAYLTETKKAKYPRIICDDTIIKLSQAGKDAHSANQDLDTFFEIVQPDDDKYWYIDYFEGIESIFYDNYEHVDYLLKLKALIIDNLSKAAHENIKEKYLWMRDKYNEAVNNILSTIEQIPDDTVRKYVQQLTLID